MSERVDALLLAVGVVLVVGTSIFAARVAWGLADRVVERIAARARARRAAACVGAEREETPATAPTIPAPAPAEHPALDELAAARREAIREALLGVRVARHVQLGAALRGDRRGAWLAQQAIEAHARDAAALVRAAAEARPIDPGGAR